MITVDTESFARMACGRIDPVAVLDTGDVALAGDTVLGRRVLEQLNYLF